MPYWFDHGPVFTPRSSVGSRTGAPAGRLTVPRFQSPPRRTQHADFPHCAPPFASRQSLWGLPCWGDFRPVASHSIGVKQPSSVVQPPPIPSFPAIGVLALVALFLAMAVPNLPHQKDGPKAALAEFQPFLASVEASQSARPESRPKSCYSDLCNGAKNQHRLQDLSDSAIKSGLGRNDNVCRPIKCNLGLAKVCKDRSFDSLFV